MMKICMESSMNRVGNIVILSLLIIGVLYISISTTDISKNFLQFKYYQCSSSSSSNETTGNLATSSQLDELETVLSKASMGNNKTLIITVVNKAYVEGEKPMLDLFLDSFWVGEDTQFLINHLLLVAMDQIAYDRCMFLRLHCYRLVTDGVDFGGEKLYMSRDFINMMWRRTLFLAHVLQRGYTFIFTDIDVMWLRNPFLRIPGNETDDMEISCDKFGTKQWCRNNLINTGFYFVRSNNKTINLFNKWYISKNNTKYIGMKEQDVLKSMIHGGEFKELGLRVSFLDTLYFSGFCENSKRFGLVTTVHANCCRTINAKVVDLTAVLRDWKKLKELIVGWKKKKRGETVIGWSDHKACYNSWRGFNESLA